MQNLNSAVAASSGTRRATHRQTGELGTALPHGNGTHWDFQPDSWRDSAENNGRVQIIVESHLIFDESIKTFDGWGNGPTPKSLRRGNYEIYNFGDRVTLFVHSENGDCEGIKRFSEDDHADPIRAAKDHVKHLEAAETALETIIGEVRAAFGRRDQKGYEAAVGALSVLKIGGQQLAVQCPQDVECAQCGYIFSPEITESRVCPDCGAVVPEVQR